MALLDEGIKFDEYFQMSEYMFNILLIFLTVVYRRFQKLYITTKKQMTGKHNGSVHNKETNDK